MTVAKNLGYGLKVRKTPKAEIERRVEEVARLLGLQDLLQRRPGALSGGQRQRVAMGRAIVREPQAFLMDEPLSNLDAKLRVDMRAELARLHDRLGITTVYVTHDQVEAMTLGSRVAVMRDGTVQQVDTPQTLYREPVNLFVAAFIGSPSMNLVEARSWATQIEFAGFRIPLNADRRPGGRESGPVILGIRPQDFEDARTADPALPRIEIDAMVVEELGSATHVLFTVEAPPVEVGLGPGGQRRRRAGDADRHRPPRALHGRGRGGVERPAGRPGRTRRRSGAAALLRSGDGREPARGRRRRPPARARARPTVNGESTTGGPRFLARALAEAGPHDPAVGARPEDDRARQGQPRLGRRRAVEEPSRAGEDDVVVVGVLDRGPRPVACRLEALGARGRGRRTRRPRGRHGARRRRGRARREASAASWRPTSSGERRRSWRGGGAGVAAGRVCGPRRVGSQAPSRSVQAPSSSLCSSPSWGRLAQGRRAATRRARPRRAAAPRAWRSPRRRAPAWRRSGASRAHWACRARPARPPARRAGGATRGGEITETGSRRPASSRLTWRSIRPSRASRPCQPVVIRSMRTARSSTRSRRSSSVSRRRSRTASASSPSTEPSWTNAASDRSQRAARARASSAGAGTPAGSARARRGGGRTSCSAASANRCTARVCSGVRSSSTASTRSLTASLTGSRVSTRTTPSTEHIRLLGDLDQNRHTGRVGQDADDQSIPDEPESSRSAALSTSGFKSANEQC